MRRTSTQTFARSSSPEPGPAFKQLLGFTDEHARMVPRTLRVDVRALQPHTSGEEEQRALAAGIGGAGVWWRQGWAPWHGGGALRIVCGRPR